MILRRIRVEGWRCFANAVEVGPLGDGLNVIHGPNGSGKSTLLWALARGLFDGHKVGGADIGSLRPWGRELNPRVVIEFEHDGAAFRLEKQFLGGQFAELSRQENGRFVRLAEGTHADEMARKLLSGSPPGRGVSDQRHWGFAQVLWATQGALRVEKLSDGTQNTIRQSLGAQISGPGADIIQQRIASAYQQIFTSTGKLRMGAGAPPVAALEERLSTLRQHRAELLKRLEAFEEVSRQIEDLRHQVRQHRQAEEQREKDIAVAQRDAEQYAELEKNCQLYDRDEKAALREYEAQKKRAERIAELRRQRKSLSEELQKLEDGVPAQRSHVAKLSEDADEAARRVAAVQGRQPEIDSALSTARLAEQFTEACGKIASDERTMQSLGRVDKEIKRVEDDRRSIVAPSAKELRQIRRLHEQRIPLQAQLDASMIQLRIVGERALELEVVSGEAPGTISLHPAEAASIKGSPEVVVHLPGIATIRATGPAVSVDELRKELAKIDQTLEKLTAGYAVADLDALEALQRQAEALDATIKEFRSERSGILATGSEEDLSGRLTRNRNLRDKCLQQQPSWAEAPPDAQRLRQSAQTAYEQHQRELQQAAHARQLAVSAQNAAQLRLVEMENDLKNKRGEVQRVEAEMADLTSDGLSDAERAEDVRGLLAAWDAKRAKLDAAKKQLAACGDDPRRIVQTLTGQRNALRKRVDESQIQLTGAETRLQTLVEESPYSALNEVEEELACLHQQIAREHLRYNAIRLLHETVTAARRAATEAVLAPVQQRATRTLQRIAGTRFQEIVFDESLLPSSILPQSCDAPVTLDYLSGGEQEQVHFAVRLALAEVALGDQRQLVVLDDAFTATDTARLARIINILVEAAQRFQIVLLSCHPERYQHLADVLLFDLVELAG